MAKLLARLGWMGILSVTVGYASWEQAFSQYEKWASGKTFVWVVESEDGWKEKGRPTRRRWLLTIQNDTAHSRWTAELLSSDMKLGITSENIFYSKDFAIFYYTGQDTSEYHIFPCTLYEGIPNGIGVDLPRMHPAFLAGAHPFKCTTIVNWIFDKKPYIYENIKNFIHKIIQNLYNFSLSGYQHPRGNWALEGVLDATRGYRPLRFSFVCGPQFEYRVLRWTRADEYWVPAEVLYTETTPSRQTTIRIKLRKIYPTNEPIAFPIPKGGRIVDWRLNDYLSSYNFDSSLKNQIGYLYIGQLPTKEQLKQLAYQQGDLVPPETPRRRYSLWLFVPAALFFLAAAYLYLKGKRR